MIPPANSVQNAEPVVAIVMATFEPDIRFFRKQISSLQNQTFRQWKCWIVDDASDPQKSIDFFNECESLVQRDPRFELIPNSKRLGVYHNFERGLSVVPDDVSFVCYADQDDVWSPQKIEKLVEAFDSKSVLLAHSDLCVVDENDRIIAPSCWALEKRSTNEYQPQFLLLKNVVTGCACMFRRELIPLLLPFPPQPSSPSFHHDLWTALCASEVGEVRGVPESLVHYRQHSSNVIGAASATGTDLRKVNPLRYARGAVGDWRVRNLLSEALNERLSQAEKLGFVPKPPIKAFHSQPDFGLAALALALSAKFRGYETRGLGIRSAVGKLGYDIQQIDKIASGFGRVAKRAARSVSEQVDLYLFKAGVREKLLPAELYRDDRSERSLNIALVKNQRPTFNCLLPNVRQEHIFGGIATAIRLMLELEKQGAAIRFLATDTKVNDEVRRQFQDYLRAKGCVKDVPLFDASSTSSQPLPLGTNDRFIATAWWTASLAHRALEEHTFTNQEFLYLIQDFEAAFSPWSSEYASALSTYELPGYLALFNTHFLADYFSEEKLGSPKHRWVIRPEIDLSRFFPGSKNTGKPRLLIYGRPSVPRNLFPLIITALDNWVKSNRLHCSDLEMISAGEKHPPVRLSNGSIIKSVGKVPPDLYPSFLRSFDMGLSLMLSPHPSYPPLEMAASGLIVVTNRYANKDLATISKNFISCDYNAKSIQNGLDLALTRITNWTSRVNSSRLELGPGLTLAEVASKLAPLLGKVPNPKRKHSQPDDLQV